MSIYRTGRGIDIRESKDININDIDMNDNDENILVNELDNWVVIKNVNISLSDRQKNKNKTMKGLRLAQNERIKVDGMRVKGFKQKNQYVIE